MTMQRFLERPAGRLAYELTGDPAGPLVVCCPGMGDLRTSYRALAQRLAADGARVASVDLRGHGQSDVGWPDYRFRFRSPLTNSPPRLRGLLNHRTSSPSGNATR